MIIPPAFNPYRLCPANLFVRSAVHKTFTATLLVPIPERLPRFRKRRRHAPVGYGTLPVRLAAHYEMDVRSVADIVVSDIRLVVLFAVQ